MCFSSERFNSIYVQYDLAIQRYLYRLTHSQQDAADLAQETFIRLFTKASPPDCVKAWLYRTAYCIFVDHWRYRKRKPVSSLEVFEEAFPDGISCSPEDAYIETETKHELQQSMDHLQDRDKLVLLLRGNEGASYEEIAKKIGCSEKVVKSVIYRARQKMKKLRENGQLVHIVG